MKPPSELLDFLKNGNSFLILIHINPDGDALGSALALSESLERAGKETILLCRDAVPQFYEFLPGCGKFHTFESIMNAGIDMRKFENLILVDCNEIKRTGFDKSEFAGTAFRKTAVIDHHETKKAFGDIKWVMPDIAATGMMIYYIIEALGMDITEEVAVNLYAALVVDTGNFRFQNTSPEVLEIAARLAEAGASPHMINRELNETWSESRFRLFINFLNTLHIEDSIAITTLTRKMFEDTSTTAEDTENFVSFPQVIKKIKVSVLLRETDDNGYKISLRSRDNINSARIAESFGGGGHRNAAGCNINAEIETVKAEIIKKIKEQMAGL